MQVGGITQSQHVPEYLTSQDTRYGASSVLPFPADVKQWVCWRGAGKKKIPIRPCLPGNMHSRVTKKSPISVTDPAHWGSLSAARARLANKQGAMGIGFVLTAKDPFMLIDFDVPMRKTVTAVDGKNTTKHKIIRDLDTYTEVSPGGGRHCYLEMTEPLGAFTGIRLEACEVYYAKRFTTVTGHVVKVFLGSEVTKLETKRDTFKRLDKVRKISRDELCQIIPGLRHRLYAADCAPASASAPASAPASASASASSSSSSSTPPVPAGQLAHQAHGVTAGLTAGLPAHASPTSPTSPTFDQEEIKRWCVRVSDEANENGRHYDLSLYGNWYDYQFPSQSEADFEVCRYFAVVCQRIGVPKHLHRVVVSTLFSACALAKRSKADRLDYIDRTVSSVFLIIDS